MGQADDDRALFDAIAARYARKDRVGYARLARRKRLLASVGDAPLGTLLEIGCGAGFAADYLAGRYRDYLGIDHSAQLVDIAARLNGAPGRRYVAADAATYTPPGRYDLVLMIGVLHHVAQPASLLERVHGWLAPGGRVVVNEPQRGNPLIGLLRALRKRVDRAYSTDQVEFSEAELLDLFRAAGFTARARPQGLFGTPFAETLLLPGPVGLPLARLATALDPPLERFLDGTPLRRLAWNMVIEAHPA